MSPDRALTSVFVVTMLLLASFSTGSTGAVSGYDIDIQDSIDTVDRTVSTPYGEFTISQIGRTAAGGTFSITVDAPSDAEYTISVLDGEQRIRRSRTASGDATATFATDGLETGTYAVAAGNQSTDEVYEVEPLVVSAYRVTVESNTTVATEGSLDVTVKLDRVESGEPVEAVQIVFANESKHVRVDATDAGDSAYTATISAETFDTGDYSLYAVVRSTDKALGERELVGVSSGRTVEVVDESIGVGSAETTTSTSGGSSGGATDATSTMTAETTRDTETTRVTTTTETTTETTRVTTTEDSVLTPNDRTPTQEQTTSSELPNTAIQTLLGVFVVLAVGRRLGQY